MDHSATLVSIAQFSNEGSNTAAEQFNFLVVLCCVMLCYAVLCCVMMYYAVLCCVMMCDAVL